MSKQGINIVVNALKRRNKRQIRSYNSHNLKFVNEKFLAAESTSTIAYWNDKQSITALHKPLVRKIHFENHNCNTFITNQWHHRQDSSFLLTSNSRCSYKDVTRIILAARLVIQIIIRASLLLLPVLG